ncbi:MAG TPA: hypothetical protein VN673_13420 [Clostridia bacterium]|nr:hypothetical protein [Clostridia bacterium]
MGEAKETWGRSDQTACSDRRGSAVADKAQYCRKEEHREPDSGADPQPGSKIQEDVESQGFFPVLLAKKFKIDDAIGGQKTRKQPVGNQQTLPEKCLTSATMVIAMYLPTGTVRATLPNRVLETAGQVSLSRPGSAMEQLPDLNHSAEKA